MEDEESKFDNFETISSELKAFESEIEEEEARDDLVQLLLEDDELFVDLELPDSKDKAPMSGDAPMAMGTGSATHGQPQLALQCSQCQKQYKRKHFLDQHQQTCTGSKRKAVKKTAVEPLSESFRKKVDSLQSGTVMCDVLTEISEDPTLAILPESPGWKTQELGKLLLKEDWNSAPLHDCATAVLSAMSKAMEKASVCKFSCAGSLEMLSSMTVSSKSLRHHWCSSIVNAGYTNDWATANCLLQHVVDFMVPCIGKKIRDISSEPKKAKKNDLSQTEKEVLHYALGYTIRKLIKNFQRYPQNKAAKLYLDLVRTWATPSDAVLSDDVTQWTKSQDRGGLIHCSAEYFHFMKAVEAYLQPLLNKDTIAKYAGENIVPVMVANLKATAEIQDSFKAMIGYVVISEVLCEGLLDEILTCWVNAKSRQVVRSYIYALKSSSSKGVSLRMGVPALRKTLDS